MPISNDVVEGAKLPVFWGDPLLQGLHIGFFIAIGALVVYWVILNRTTLGFGVRAVGFNPEAARYGGISVARNYFLAMADLGRVRGARRRDRHPRLAVPARRRATCRRRQIGFIGIAVALLGRNTAVGVVFAALLFGALVNGTSTRNLDPEIFQPELASNLTLLIQGLVVLFVGADIDRPLAARGALRRRRDGVTSVALPHRRRALPIGLPARWLDRRSSIGLVARVVALPPLDARSWVPSSCSG